MIEPESWRWSKVEPVDAWFFRDARPSNRDEDQSDIVSEFPPNPTTIVGAFRAGIARQLGWKPPAVWSDELQQVLGNGDDLGPLSFLGPFVRKDEQLLWPLPRHVVGSMTDGQFTPQALLQPAQQPVISNALNGATIQTCVFPTLPQIENEHGPDGKNATRPVHAEDVWITTTVLNKVLRNETPTATDCVHQRDIFVHETRVGIQRNADSKASESIYSPRYVRLKRGVSLVQGIHGLPDETVIPPLLMLGGESRMATVEEIAAPKFPVGSNGNSKVVVLLTHARFSNGNWWAAGPGDAASQLHPELKTGTIQTCSIDRPRLIGGWDFRTGPLPLQPYLPAASVWWLTDSSGPQGLIPIGERTAFGHGLAIISGP